MATLANVRLVGGPRDPVDVDIDDGILAAIRPAGVAQPPALLTRSGRTSDELIDFDGRWLVPGLQDHHVHLNQWAMARRRFDVSHAQSAAETCVLAAAARAEHDAASGLPLIGFGFRDGLWPDAPHRDLLDAVTGDVATAIVAGDLHSVWLNSAALRRYGYASSETGLLSENACFDVLRRLGSVPSNVLDAWVADAMQAAVARGITGVTDMEMDWNVDSWQRRESNATTPLRIRAAVYEQDLDRAIDAGWATGKPVTSSGRVSFGPLKIISDGSLNTRTAFCYEPYLGGTPDNVGVFNIDPAALHQSMARAKSAGIACAVHAIGDHANALVLDAYAATGATGSIEHAQLIRATDVARMAELGIVASIQPQHAVDDQAVADVYWADRLGDAFRMRSLVDAGVRLVLGSDAPVAALDPWVAIAAAVGRAAPGDRPWRPDEALSATEALAASTLTGRTTVREGDVADLAIVDRDPLASSPDELRAMPVAATFVAGRPVHGETAE